MLVPLTRTKFEELVPAVATGAQYIYYWDDWQTLIKRIIGSLAAVFVVWLVSLAIHASGLWLFVGIIAGLYWLWAPVAKASFRNNRHRRYPYSGFWQGRILDVYVTEEVTGTEETTNQYGELVIVENRERRLNLEVGDRTGFETRLQVPLKKQHQLLAPGLAAQMLVLSQTPDLSSIALTSDIYVPSRNVWVSDYPMVQREAFLEVSRRLSQAGQSRRSSPARSRRLPDDRDAGYEDASYEYEADYGSSEGKGTSANMGGFGVVDDGAGTNYAPDLSGDEFYDEFSNEFGNVSASQQRSRRSSRRNPRRDPRRDRRTS